MNTATLDKATDKVIDKMTPEELAKYANNSFNMWAKGVYFGNLSHDEQCREVETFTSKHVDTLAPPDYLKYTRALYNETCTTLVKLLAEEQFKNLNLWMLNIELIIESQATAFEIIGTFNRQNGYSEDLKDELLEDARETLKPHFIKLQGLKAEGKQYLEDPNWAKFGGAPVLGERKSILRPQTVALYAPTTFAETEVIQ